MLDHVTIRVSDLSATRRFYATVLDAQPDELSLVAATADRPPTRHLHIALAAASREEVDAFWRRGVDAGYRSDGEPGPRPAYDPNYYGGFLLDPDGNSVEAVTGHREFDPALTRIDHLWLGVADLEASKRFYERLAPVLGVRVREPGYPGLVSVSRNNRHFALIADGRPPTQNLGLSFPVPDDETREAFRRVAAATDHRDPDGNTVEAVVR